MKFDLTEQEAILTREALTDYKIKLRTIHSPTGDQELTERDFLASDITERRRSNYFSVCDILSMINTRIK